MNTFTSFAACALCAVPALIQPALAEEASTPAEAFLEQSIALFAEYAGTIEAIVDEKVTITDAIKTIDGLTTKATTLMGSLASFSEADKKQLGELMQDPEVAKMMEELTVASEQLAAALKEKNYFDNKELQAACEKFTNVGK